MPKVKKNKAIILSPKYGLNPTIPLCFWCKKPKDEIAVLGKIGKRREDIEAPKNMVIDYEPCPICKGYMDSGFTVIEVDKKPNSQHQAELSENVYPTGRWTVVKEASAKKIFGKDSKSGSRVFMDCEVYEQIFKEFLGDED